MVQVASRRRNRPVPELLADDPDVHALRPELGGVGVPQPVGVDPLLDSGLLAQVGEEPAYEVARGCSCRPQPEQTRAYHCYCRI